jgi:hypothetical protein
MMYQGQGMPSSTYLPASDTLDGNESIQLSNLSSVLNGLDGGARLMQEQLHKTLRAIQTGTYCVDSIQLSRRIIGEALRIV